MILEMQNLKIFTILEKVIKVRKVECTFAFCIFLRAGPFIGSLRQRIPDWKGKKKGDSELNTKDLSSNNLYASLFTSFRVVILKKFQGNMVWKVLKVHLWHMRYTKLSALGFKLNSYLGAFPFCSKKNVVSIWKIC